MPTTRRRRANPPEQPENNNHASGQTENTVESQLTEQASNPTTESIAADNADAQSAPAAQQEQQAQQPAQTQQTPPLSPESVSAASYQPVIPTPPASHTAANGDRSERQDNTTNTPSIEGGRRTSRGELFRRPPQPPVPQPAAMATPLQPPTHEISLPLGNLLHLAYNPGYTGSDEARSNLLQQLALESKAGGRARCWNCGSIAIVYDRWNTRSRTFGEVGIAFCEICGVWSVM